MKVAYFDCLSGISGDMVLGALLDIGLKLPQLESELRKLDISGYSIKAEKVTKGNISATKATIIDNTTPEPRRFTEIVRIIEKSKLSTKIKNKAVKVFTELAKAEASVHGEDLKTIHFHEVGAVDAIVDIVGASIGLVLLKLEPVYSSSLPIAQPAPATLKIVEGLSIHGTESPIETVTPTGAAIIKALSTQVSSLPPMEVAKTGYGAGTADIDVPNVLRIITGKEMLQSSPRKEKDNVVLIETNIDNMSSELISPIINKLLDSGALDAWFTPIFMKKNRPAILLSILTRPEEEEALIKIVFTETGSLGVRKSALERRKLQRKQRKVSTEYGRVTVNLGFLDGKIVSVNPEFEDCYLAAKKNDVPIKEVYRSVQKEIDL